MADREENINAKGDRNITLDQPQSTAFDVKSTAMVKSSRKLPVYQFSKLDLNTDLHTPPDNWLRNEPQLSKTWVTGECTQFSSFAMAETSPDTVGEVDVITASENIKKLLKIPFSKTQVSMAVHRVGRTLLLDELDLFKHLRSATQGEREWMKTFIIQAVLSEGKNLTMKRKTNELLQNWNLLSKFLYYSIGNSSEEPVPQPHFDIDEQHLAQSQSALVQIPDLLTKTKPSEFARQVLWQFEDIRMLIGTDLPIFGEGIHPAVSLRLRDMASPINVLTGLDYWLDNLMSNVPELAMCYHLNGIVQKYELLKTEEIPNVEDAKFAPQVVKDVAQNILSFLKSHCTKEGHTYWLFKGQDEDVVKLYDLTSLCNEYPNRPWENPFISPVAVLLYRVARNLSMAGPNKKDKSTIYKLLRNCLQLLEGSETRHSEIAASANYLLSHIFINEDDLTDRPPSKSTKKQPAESSSGDEEEEFLIGTEDEGEAALNVTTVGTQSLKLPSVKHGEGSERHRKRRRSAKTVYASREEKAKMALKHVVKGLKSIKECPEPIKTHDQSHSAKMSSPLPSPTRVKPLCYTKPVLTDSQGDTASAKVQQVQLDQIIGSDPGGVPAASELKNESQAHAQPYAWMERNRDVNDLMYTAKEQAGLQAGTPRGNPKIPYQANLEASSVAVPIETLPEDSPSQMVAARQDGESKLKPVSSSEEKGSSEQTSTARYPMQETQDPSVCGLPAARSSKQDSLATSGCGLAERTHHWLPEEAPPVPDSQIPINLSVAPRKLLPGSWQHKSTFLLLRKASESYLVLSKAACDAQNYGQSLHFAKMSLLCHSSCQSMKLPDSSDGPSLLSDLLMVCGDGMVLITHNFDSYMRHREDFVHTTEDDRFMLGAVAELHQPANEFEWALDFKDNTEHNLRTGILCYSVALSKGVGHTNEYLTTLTRKQGNARNELGVYYMNQSLTIMKEQGGLQKGQELWRKSLMCFESGIEIFKTVNDVANMALLLCNSGKLMRMCAFSLTKMAEDAGTEMSRGNTYYYTKAVEFYQRALNMLGQRKRNPALWESVSWELSSTYFVMATVLQDHPPLSSMAQEQIEKDIMEMMNKALGLCEVDDITPARQPVYQYRSATIHHRLASLHHNSYRNQMSQHRQKQTRSLAELHYQRAVRLFKDLDRPSELLRVLLERVALLEHQFKGQSGTSARIKTLHAALDVLLQSKEALTALHRGRVRDSTELQASSAASTDQGDEIARRGESRTAVHEMEADEGLFHGCGTKTLLRFDAERASALTEMDGSFPIGHNDLGTVQQEKQECDTTEGVSSHELDVSNSPGRPAQGQGPKIKDGSTKEEENEGQRLEALWGSRLQFVLLNLANLHGANKKGQHLVLVYKKMYAASLGRTGSSSSPSAASSSSSSSSMPPATKTPMSIIDDVQQLLQSVK